MFGRIETRHGAINNASVLFETHMATARDGRRWKISIFISLAIFFFRSNLLPVNCNWETTQNRSEIMIYLSIFEHFLYYL